MTHQPPTPSEARYAMQLAQDGLAPNQCAECGVYRIDGGVPQIHVRDCESSGTAGHYRHMMDPTIPDDPRWIELFMKGLFEL